MAFGKSQTSKYYTTLRSRAFKVPTVEARRAYYDTIYAKDHRGCWVITDVPSCFCGSTPPQDAKEGRETQ